MKKNKVIVAMSGGVDSSIAAALLKKAGYEVIGIFLKFWHDSEKSITGNHQAKNENKCCSIEAAEVARRVAQKLNIPFYVLNFEKDFKKEVVDYFLNEYQSGRTPNPCVKCNQLIKFGKLLEKMHELGADYLATGHYARIASNKSNKTNWSNLSDQSNLTNWKLLEAKDKQKDQSYFLWNLKQNQLKHLIFPVGDYTKEQVREMATKWGLPSASRRESQEICFVYGSLVDFLKKYLKAKPGKIVDLQGRILGEHNGAIFYTIGQRQNLNIKPTKPTQKPFYIVRTDIKKNLVIVGEDKELYSKKLVAREINWIDKSNLANKTNWTNLTARIRYGHPKEKVKIKIKKEKVLVEFKKPQRAITPGQSIVFYNREEVLGGGVIQ